MHFTTHSAYEMSTVGDFSKDKLTIRIFAKEGPVPHFHFDNEEKEVHGCIRIDKAEYFSHGRHQAQLNSQQKKSLVEYLSAPADDAILTGTNWQFVLFLWNHENPQHKISFIEMPDYTKLQ